MAPNAVIQTSVATFLAPNSASLKWQGVADDSIGIGVYEYVISRNGTAMATIFEPEFADATVVPSTSYTYSVVAVDFIASNCSLVVFGGIVALILNISIGVIQSGAESR